MKNFVDLKSRLIISAINFFIVAFLIWFSLNHTIQFIILLLIIFIAELAIWEYCNLLKSKKIHVPFWLLASLAGAYLFANYLTVLNPQFSILLSTVVAIFFFTIFVYNFFQVEGAIVNIAASFFGALYIVIPIGFMFRILYPESITHQFDDGRVWLTFLLSVTKVTDIGGYFFGKMWGKSKLAPHLSPGKTLIGSIGGFFSAVFLSICFFFISNICSPRTFHLTWIQALSLGALIGVFGQLGDLAESLLKRDAKVKDSNHIPGIGGALDLLDSLLFTAPIVYLFLRAIYL